MSELKDELNQLYKDWKALFGNKPEGKSTKRTVARKSQNPLNHGEGMTTNQKIAVSAIVIAVLMAGFSWYNSPFNSCIRSAGHSVWDGVWGDLGKMPIRCFDYK